MKKLLSKTSFLKAFHQSFLKHSTGFTLIEILIVIAIIGVIVAVLIVVIDPADKINAGYDAGVISTVSQIGKGNDSYAINNNGIYAPAGTFSTLVSTLNASGNSKISSYTPPSSSYSIVLNLPSGCPVTPDNCKEYVIFVNLKSKKYTSKNKNFWVWDSRGQGCFGKDQPGNSTPYCSQWAIN